MRLVTSKCSQNVESVVNIGIGRTCMLVDMYSGFAYDSYSHLRFFKEVFS